MNNDKARSAELKRAASRKFRMPAKTSGPLIPIGAFEYASMIVVSELGKDAYLKQVQERLQAILEGIEPGRVVNGGQVSGALRALVHRGFLTSQTAPNPRGIGAPIIVYTVTEEGARLMELASDACAFGTGEETKKRGLRTAFMKSSS